MKKIIFTIIMTILLISCYKKKVSGNQNKVVLLKVDFLTYAFEGGKELNFSPSPTFTISYSYQPPGDFGSVQLYYEELNELLFDGTIVWSGFGEMSFPSIDSSSTFTTIIDTIQMPDTSLFEYIMKEEFSYYPDTTSYSTFWNSIDNLEIVKEYRDSNPNGAVSLFLYTPNVGIGNPLFWDWFIILKN